jgi:hypothetical protein
MRERSISRESVLTMTGKRFAVVSLSMALATALPRAANQRTLSVPGRASAHVSLASAGAFVAAAWSASSPGGVTDVYLAASVDGGETFSAPIRVNSNPGEARVNGEQPPRLALSPRPSGPPEIVVIWTAKGSTGTRLLTARSVDRGRTFTHSAHLPGTDAAGNRGWEAIGAGQRGVYTAWLDHRRLAAQETAMAAGHRHGGAHAAPSGDKPDGVAMAQLSDLYVARLGGGSLPAVVTAGVCYCCKTAIASGPRDDVFVAWRHVYPGNLRDIAFSASRDAGRTFSEPVRVSEDRWEIAGCPDDGPTMVVEPRGRIHIVWPTVIDESGAIVKALFHSRSNDGRTFVARQRIPTRGQANHPQMVMAADGSVLVAWDESGDGPRRIAYARGTFDPAGAISFQRLPSGGAEPGTYPAVAPLSDGALLAWTAGDPASSVIRLERVQ